MIRPGIVNEVRRLLNEEGLSQRTVATRTGVSRSTVCAIARGTRPDYESRRREPDPFPPPTGPARRCPTCGRRVQMPCLACRITAMRKLAW